jgi:hypothetical protein
MIYGGSPGHEARKVAQRILAIEEGKGDHEPRDDEEQADTIMSAPRRERSELRIVKKLTHCGKVKQANVESGYGSQ